MEQIQLEPFTPFTESPEQNKPEISKIYPIKNENDSEISEISKSYQIKNEIEKVEMFKGLKKTITGGKQFIRQLSKSIV